MNQELSNQQKEVESKKRNAWGNMGVAIHQNEMQIQARSQQIIKTLEAKPTEISQVPEAEEKLKVAKSMVNQLVVDRKKITTPLDEVISRLMEPEKTATQIVKEFEAAIIPIKKAEEARGKLETDKQNERTQLIEKCKMLVIESDSKLKTKINDLISTAYEFALTRQNKDKTVGVPINDVNDYVNLCIEAGKKKLLEIAAETIKFKPLFISEEEAEQIVNMPEHCTITEDYFQAFEKAMKERFSDYEVAFQNKKDALELSAKEKAEAEALIAKEKMNETISASMSAAAATPSIVKTETKALKKSFEIDMPETFESAMLIMAAFIANKEKAIQKTTVKKWFSFNAESAGKALAKFKSEDNSLSFSGINFKEVDKL